MQNFIICSKRQCVLLQKIVGLPFKYNAEKYGVYNVKHSNINFSTQVNRLCSPLLQRLHIRTREELNNVLSVFSKNEPYRMHFFQKLCNRRNFSTTSNSYQQSTNESAKDPGKDPKASKEFYVMLIKVSAFFACFIILIYLIHAKVLNLHVNIINWNDFVHRLLLKGQVQEIRIDSMYALAILKDGATIDGKGLSKMIYIYDTPQVKDIEPKIRAIEKHIGIKMEDGILIRYISAAEENALNDVIATVLLLVTMYFLLRHPLLKAKFNIFSDLRKAKYTLVDPFGGKGIRFKDVAGLQEAKVEVMEFVDYLKNPERYKKLGAKVPKGALLLGPPGCGKTLLAKAVATESNVPFLSMNGSEFIEIVGGLGAARVRSLFAEAKKRAPSIIYIDEIDAIGKKRTESYPHMGDSESERTLNQLLVEMDGMTTVEDIIIMASTNRADVLDKALLRHGRFDRHILIDLPTLTERTQIFEYHLNSLSLEGDALQFAKYLAHLTPGFSGAEIANVCNESALHAASEQKTKVDKSDLMYAVDKVIGGTVKKSSTLTPSEKKVVVYHEAGHAVAAWLLEHVNPLIKITVVPRTNKRLGFTQYSDSDLKLQSSEHLFERMCVLLGGRVVENIMFNKVSTRAQNDLKKATEIAYHQVQQFGMSPSVGLVSFDKELTSTKTKKPYSKKLGNLMDAEVRRIITEAYKTTEKLLHDNKDKVTTLAEALLKKETLSYMDIEALIGPPPFGQKDLPDLQQFTPNIE